MSANAAATDLEVRVWEWLPARADRRRSTVAAAIAAGVGAPLVEVAGVLRRLEALGCVVRDRATGVRSSSWHRGVPLPGAPEPDGIVTECASGTLFGVVDNPSYLAE